MAMAMAAKQNLKQAAVNAPIPVWLILIATAFAPKMMFNTIGPMAEVADIVSFFGVIMLVYIHIDGVGQVLGHWSVSGSSTSAVILPKTHRLSK